MTSDFFSYHINWKSRGVHPGATNQISEEWELSLPDIPIF
jgi:hypothetical protein